MEKYSKAVSEMCSQFKQGEAHPLEKYVGRTAVLGGARLEAVGYRNGTDSTRVLIVDCTKLKGWVGGGCRPPVTWYSKSAGIIGMLVV